MQEMIAEFESLVPPKSLLNRELRALQKERDKQQLAFESATDKMDYDTSPYRRANFAIDRFLDEWMPRIRVASVQLDEEAKKNLDVRQASILNWEYGSQTPVDRRSEATIWMHFVLDRYRTMRPAARRAKMYHPHIIGEILSALKTFRHELRLWKYARVPFDGSQAMASMFQFILKLDLLAAVND